VTSDASNLYVINLQNATRTTVASYSSSVSRSLYSQPVSSTFQFKEPNGTSVSNAPSVYSYDLSSCEKTVAYGCAHYTSQWNLYLKLGFGWDSTGNQHCTFDGPGTGCEFEAHDFYLRRGHNNTVWNYGGSSVSGEGIFFQTSLSGTGTIALYPNTATNTPYLSHPAFDYAGDYALYSGPRSCMPSGHTCSANQTFGIGVWNFKSNTAAAFIGNVDYGHGTWDGFNDNLFGFDGQCTINSKAHWCLNRGVPNWGAGTISTNRVFDFGLRNVNNSTGSTAFALYYGPTQSPDATKLAEAIPTSFSASNQYEGWVAVVASPVPPVNVVLTTSKSATLGWHAASLNHEAKAYHVYKQNSCSGAWDEIDEVSSNYWDNFAVGQNPKQYTFTDTNLNSGATACYGISTEEWSGIEGSTLSAILKITDKSGVFSSTSQAGAGTAGFDRESPAAPSGLSSQLIRIPTPNAPITVSQTTGGSLSDGTYWVRVAYCNFSDFPANTSPRCTGTGAVVSVNVTGSGGKAALSISTAKDMFGQMAEQIYVGGPSPGEPSEKLQKCSGQASTVTVPWFPDGYPGQVTCTVTSVGSGVLPSASNRSVLGYKLNWTASYSKDVRYYAIYEDDSAAPKLDGVNAYTAQQYLIATVPANSTNYVDYLPNWTRIYNQNSVPFYGIVAVDREGNRSSAVCIRADDGGNVPCN